MSETNTNPTSTRSRINPFRAGLTGAVVAIVVIVAIGALIVATTYATRLVTADATVLQHAEATLGANEVALKSLSQAVLLAEDVQLGVAQPDTAEAAFVEAQRALAELERHATNLQQSLEGLEPSVEAAFDDVRTATERVLTLITDGETSAAGEELIGPGKAAFEQYRDAVGAVRADREAAVDGADNLVSRLGSIAAFLVAFLVPVGAIFAYRSLARRQLHMAEIELDARIAAEREVVKAKDEFIADISHELRTPLTTIYGFSEVLLEQGLIDPESAIELIGLINSESSELSRMIDDLLASARAEAGAITFKDETFEIVDEIDTVLKPIARGESEITVECRPGTVRADRLRTRQVIRNLISNAAKHGGHNIRVIGRPDGEVFECVVADDGQGVDPEMVPRLFSRFVHGSGEALTTGSVGLGLAVAKALTEGMSGTLDYERVDGWTRFVFRLPMAVPSRVASIPSRPEVVPQPAFTFSPPTEGQPPAGIA